MMQILNLSSFCSSKVLAPVATGEFRPSQRVRHPLELKTSDASSWGSFTKRRNLCRQQIRRSVVASASATGWWQQFPELWTSIHGQQELDNILTSSADVVLVDCYTQHCGGCKLIQPALSRVAADDEFRGKVTFAKVDTDEFGDFAKAHGVQTLPYVLIFRKAQGKIFGMQISPYRLKLLKPALQTILKNSDCKEFRVDPNGFVIPI